MSIPPTAMTEQRSSDFLGHARPAPSLPRLLAGIAPHGAMTLDEHLALHGPLPRAQGRRRQVRERAALLVDEIERSGLLGRGGAGFPTATKMRAVAGGCGRAIVIANGAEGEPASLKDRTLMETLPHLVLDGAVLAAEAVGADEVIVCACETAGESAECLQQALAERAAERSLSDGSPKVRLVPVPSHYVAGQEAALVNFLGGGPAKPTFTPPMVFEQGLRRRPTLVDNVETLAHVALIARHGAPWFRELGTPTQPGSTLLTLSGPVANPGVYEIEHGASLTSLIEASGGTTTRVRAALLGGYAGAWIGGEVLPGVALSSEHLAPHGATLGAGIVVLLSEDACPVAETARVARWMSGQSARQCGPCIHGLDALADTLEEIVAGIAHANALKRLGQLASLTARRGACAHPDGAVNLTLSAVEVFESELADHARHGPCERCSRPAELPLPYRPVIETPRRRSVRA